VLASYRGPVAFARGPDGELTSSRGAGGLVTALTGIAAGHPHTTWVCAADGPEDEAVAAEHPGEPVEAEDIRLRFVPLDAEAQRLAYTVVANPLLWFIQHGLWGSATAPVLTADDHRAYEHGYRPVNEAIADAVAEEVERAGGRALVMVQDYHLYLVPGLVRARFPDVVLTHFVHIPWPGPDAWRVLPRGMRDELITGLLGADVVAFHTEHFAREFLLCAQELLGLPVDLEALTVPSRSGRARSGRGTTRSLWTWPRSTTSPPPRRSGASPRSWPTSTSRTASGSSYGWIGPTRARTSSAGSKLSRPCCVTTRSGGAR